MSRSILRVPHSAGANSWTGGDGSSPNSLHEIGPKLGTSRPRPSKKALHELALALRDGLEFSLVFTRLFCT